jgi:predicted ATPase
MASGLCDESLRVLTESLIGADERGIRFYEAETYRLKGESLLKQADTNTTDAQNCFERAIEVAKQQGAKSFELRATASLARLLSRHGRRDIARELLSDIYHWFAEGFDTADLKDAKALLDELR